MLEPMEKMKRTKSIKLYGAKLDPAEVERRMSMTVGRALPRMRNTFWNPRNTGSGATARR
jgi:hypothetical protein